MCGLRSQTTLILPLLIILMIGSVVHVRLWANDTKNEDIYFAWVEGGRILAGENPYSRIHAGDMHVNDKYATYFPVFYGFSALTQWAGLSGFAAWIVFWRSVFLGCNLAIAGMLYFLTYPRGRLLGAGFAAAFWLFNRWTLYVTQVAHLDFIAIALLIASLGLFFRHRRASLLLFSLSLGVKQIAIFLAPLYLIWTWHTARQDRLKQTLQAGALIASIPTLVSLPFLAWDAAGFIKSLIFSVTRNPVDHFSVTSLDGYMGWLGMTARLPLFLMLVAVYGLAWRGQIGLYMSSLLALVTFTDFNAVLFRQYLTWIVPLIPLAVLERVRSGGVCDDARNAQSP
jgi:hypothetical protein